MRERERERELRKENLVLFFSPVGAARLCLAASGQEENQDQGEQGSGSERKTLF